MYSLENYNQYDSRQKGAIRVEKWPINRAMDAYRHTLINIPGRMEGEPPAATMVGSAQIEWRAEPAKIGYKVRQRHLGLIHPGVRDVVATWIKAGKPFPSGGGIYHTIPNKSFERIEALSKYPEMRDIVRNWGAEEEWFRFWEKYLPLRYDASAQLLELARSRVDPEALSRHNEEAGTGLQIRGRRLKRKDLKDVAEDLTFLLEYSYMMGAIFAAVQIAPLPADSVWVAEVYDNRIKGALASRSDMDIQEIAFDGERLTIEGVAQTRQVGSDATGVLSNSDTERRLMGSSVTERVLKENKHDRVHYPFTSRRMLTEMWGLDAKPFPGKEYVIGEDLGLDSPVKAGADNLFSRCFLKIGAKVVPMMLSGSGWTSSVYSVFHNHIIEKTAPSDQLLAFGDDLNLRTGQSTEDVFHPYIKVKSTDPMLNRKKILGIYTVMSIKPDPTEEEEALMGIVPRVFKSVSSATKRGGYWEESLSNLPMAGKKELVISAEVRETVIRDLPILLPYIQWKGKRRDLMPFLDSKWGRISPEELSVLLRHDDELQYRLRPEAEETTTDRE